MAAAGASLSLLGIAVEAWSRLPEKVVSGVVPAQRLPESARAVSERNLEQRASRPASTYPGGR